jgi:hypothetical protein
LFMAVFLLLEDHGPSPGLTTRSGLTRLSAHRPTGAS